MFKFEISWKVAFLQLDVLQCHQLFLLVCNRQHHRQRIRILCYNIMYEFFDMNFFPKQWSLGEGLKLFFTSLTSRKRKTLFDNDFVEEIRSTLGTFIQSFKLLVKLMFAQTMSPNRDLNQKYMIMNLSLQSRMPVVLARLRTGSQIDGNLSVINKKTIWGWRGL